jgi:hypothetical protein
MWFNVLIILLFLTSLTSIQVFSSPFYFYFPFLSALAAASSFRALPSDSAMFICPG